MNFSFTDFKERDLSNSFMIKITSSPELLEGHSLNEVRYLREFCSKDFGTVAIARDETTKHRLKNISFIEIGYTAFTSNSNSMPQ